MKTSAVATVFLAALAAATPVKRAYKTDVIIDVVTATIYVTAGQVNNNVAVATATSTTSSRAHRHKHSRPAYVSSSSSVVVVELPPTTQAAPVVHTVVVSQPPVEVTPTQAPVATVAPVAPAASSTPAVVPAPYSGDSGAPLAGDDNGPGYKSQVVHHHNIHRANHSAPDLKWSDDLASSAKTLAEMCKYKHDTTVGTPGYGQNMAIGTHAKDIAQAITNGFYNSEVTWFHEYDVEPNLDEESFKHWGHFSQIVWKATTEVGCYTADCSKIGNGNVQYNPLPSEIPPLLTFCNYKSPGNFGGQYAKNIGRPLGHPTVEAA